MAMNEKLIKYLLIQVAEGKLTKEQVIEKYPEMAKYFEENNLSESDSKE